MKLIWTKEKTESMEDKGTSIQWLTGAQLGKNDLRFEGGISIYGRGLDGCLFVVVFPVRFLASIAICEWGGGSNGVRARCW